MPPISKSLVWSRTQNTRASTRGRNRALTISIPRSLSTFTTISRCAIPATLMPSSPRSVAHLEIVVKVLKDLGIEIVSARLRPLVEALVFCVLDHTNDFEIGGMCGIAFDAKPAANWRTTRKIDARHRFVDYGDLRRCGGVLRAKSASDE